MKLAVSTNMSEGTLDVVLSITGDPQFLEYFFMPRTLNQIASELGFATWRQVEEKFNNWEKKE